MVQFGMLQFIYLFFSIIVVSLVAKFGVWGSQYVPREREKLAAKGQGGSPDVPTD